MSFPTSCFWFFIASLGATGCVYSKDYTHTATAARLASVPSSSVPALLPQSDLSISSFQNRNSVEAERLARLWERRKQQDSASDYPIGPGDIVEISVPAMEELGARTVRISGEGTIALPFLGVVAASGLTEEQLRQELHRRLQEYMHYPQVNLFVGEYRSRQVAVLGAVMKPGFYNLASGGDTLLDVISLAGGTNADAALWICLNPSEEHESRQPTRVASTHPVPPVSISLSPGNTPNVEPLIIALEDETGESNRGYLSLPARPGDVITVPTRGEVLVHGWVAKPGPYKITPGLTVLGAVMAAGGPVFAAKLDAVKILRREDDGREAFLPANLEDIRQGVTPDIPVRGNDIVVVSASSLKVIPYSFYQFLSSALHVGANVPLY